MWNNGRNVTKQNLSVCGGVGTCACMFIFFNGARHKNVTLKLSYFLLIRIQQVLLLLLITYLFSFRSYCVLVPWFLSWLVTGKSMFCYCLCLFVGNLVLSLFPENVHLVYDWWTFFIILFVRCFRPTDLFNFDVGSILLFLCTSWMPTVLTFLHQNLKSTSLYGDANRQFKSSALCVILFVM